MNAEGGHYSNALRVASINGHEAIVELLLEYGAEVNEKPGPNLTALQIGRSNGHEGVVELLLRNGARDLSIANSLRPKIV